MLLYVYTHVCVHRYTINQITGPLVLKAILVLRAVSAFINQQRKLFPPTRSAGNNYKRKWDFNLNLKTLS